MQRTASTHVTAALTVAADLVRICTALVFEVPALARRLARGIRSSRG